MDFFKATLEKQTFEVYDSRTMPFEADKYSHFALVDALLEKSGREERGMVHFWPTDRLIFLGMQDTRAPYFHEGLNVFEDRGYAYVVRNSGGLGVVGDKGILNFSIILPNEHKFALSIDEGYQLMHDLIQASLPEVPILAEEIPNSYCPGDYDLSINGQKIAGIAQRRSQGGLAVMIYISVDGDQDYRSLMMRDFYQVGTRGEETQWKYPEVDPAVMTTITEATGSRWTVSTYIDRIKDVLSENGYPLEEGFYDERMTETYQVGYDKMIQRNKKMLKDKF